MKSLKTLLHRLLQKGNRWLLYSPPGTPTGWNLQHDLRIVVPREDPLILDVGANMGQSIELFSSVFKTPVIHSFEPTPACYKHIAGQRWNATVHAHHMAIGDAEGRLTLNEYGLSVLNSVLEIDEAMKSRWQDITPLRQTEVTVRPLDAVVRELALPAIDILKTDTQGFDLHVLRGASDLLRTGRIKAIVIELNHGNVYRNQDRALDILRCLDDHAYRLVDLYEKFRNGPSVEWSTGLFLRVDSDRSPENLAP